MTGIQKLNLILRSAIEAGIVLAFGWWGYHAGSSQVVKIILMIATPVFGFGFWGLVDFHQLGKMAEPARLLQELVISGLAALALYISEEKVLGIILAVLSVVYHGLVYLSGNRLLKKQRKSSTSR